MRVFISLLCGTLLLSSPGAEPGGGGPGAVSFPEREAEARRRVLTDTEDADVWLGLGRVLFEQGRPEDLDEALRSLNRAVALDPGLAPAWFWLGRASGQAAGQGGVLKRIQLAGRAREAFARAVELEPDSFEYTYALIQFHLRAPALAGGSRDRAADLADRFDPDRSDERALLAAAVRLADRDHAGAGEQLDRVGPFGDPLVAETWATLAGELGAALLERERWPEAVEAYRRVTTRLPDGAAGWLGLGRALEGAGRPGEAADAFRHCLKAALPGPVAEAATRALARLESGD
jgi:tetratricopeptide (TPR) repeat protein